MNIVKIRLRKPRRVFSFLCADMLLQREEHCIVQSDRGTEWGTCILPPEPCSPELEKRFSMHVVRRVEPDDEHTHYILVEEEAKAFKICQEKIHRREMPMKLVDAEYTFDKKKVIFYFTADERVDFRELVRDLAHDLRTRIELRHIQVRDEAKMVGGIGGCGRQLCCTTWLNEFKPISMRMAKKQNLSLNPSKISGQCGRLLCCLSYENDQYEGMKRRARKPSEEGAPQAAGGAGYGEFGEFGEFDDVPQDAQGRRPEPARQGAGEQRRPAREQQPRRQDSGRREARDRNDNRGPRRNGG